MKRRRSSSETSQHGQTRPVPTAQSSAPEVAVAVTIPVAHVESTAASTSSPPNDLPDHLRALARYAETLDVSGSRPYEKRMNTHNSARPKQLKDPVALGQCEICHCQYTLAGLVKFPCGHKSCFECLRIVIKVTLRDESLFPPRCCGEEYEVNSARIGPELYAKYEQKKVEWTAPKRLYCHVRTCSAFIASEYIDDQVATCPECHSKTCTSCKAQAHGGECVIDEATKEVLELAKKEGWQQCRKCERMVEKSEACHHMTCNCGHEFCYLCGANYNPKECDCEEFDYDSENEEEEEDEAILEYDQDDQRTWDMEDRGFHVAEALAEQYRAGCCHVRRDLWFRFNGRGGRCHVCRFWLLLHTNRCLECGYDMCDWCLKAFESLEGITEKADSDVSDEADSEDDDDHESSSYCPECCSGDEQKTEEGEDLSDGVTQDRDNLEDGSGLVM